MTPTGPTSDPTSRPPDPTGRPPDPTGRPPDPTAWPPDLTAWPPDPVERAAAAAAAGLRRPVRPEIPAGLAALVAADPDPRVRAAALGALARLPGPPSETGARAEQREGGRHDHGRGGGHSDAAADRPADVWTGAAADADPSVRRRAAELAPAFAAGTDSPADLSRGATSVSATDFAEGHASRDLLQNRSAGHGATGIARILLPLLADGDVAVAEAAAWALGELGSASVAAGAVGPLSQAAGTHPDPLVREAAVAALGAIGDPDGLDAVLAACGDKPAIRRRAVLALAAFDGPEVDAALRAALDDKDWQTRQAAEDLRGPEDPGPP